MQSAISLNQFYEYAIEAGLAFLLGWCLIYLGCFVLSFVWDTVAWIIRNISQVVRSSTKKFPKISLSMLVVFVLVWVSAKILFHVPTGTTDNLSYVSFYVSAILALVTWLAYLKREILGTDLRDAVPTSEAAIFAATSVATIYSGISVFG